MCTESGHLEFAGALSEPNGSTGTQKIAITAIAQCSGTCNEPDGPAAQMMGFPGGAGWNPTSAEQAAGDLTMRMTVCRCVECAQTEDQALSFLWRDFSRPVGLLALHLVPKRKRCGQPLWQQLIERDQSSQLCV